MYAYIDCSRLGKIKKENFYCSASSTKPLGCLSSVLESLLHNFFIGGGELSFLNLQGFLNGHYLNDWPYLRSFYFRSLNGAAKVQEGYAVRHNPNRPVAWLTLESVRKSFVELKLKVPLF